MSVLHLENIEFYAYHGCFDEESLCGTHFLVNLWLDTDTQQAEISDDITDTINYQEVYYLVKEQMQQRSHLIEHVARRILNALFDQFPELNAATIRLSKKNPPIGGKLDSVSVEMKQQR
jgi:dihydroneopterin aldolase